MRPRSYCAFACPCAAESRYSRRASASSCAPPSPCECMPPRSCCAPACPCAAASPNSRRASSSSCTPPSP
eukprot:3538863-Prymnesium_polylepis.1